MDRRADVFLATEASADGWMVKPIDSLRLRRMAKQLLAGESYFEGLPEPDPAPAGDPNSASDPDPDSAQDSAREPGQEAAVAAPAEG